jgi:hypothetical protein
MPVVGDQTHKLNAPVAGLSALRAEIRVPAAVLAAVTNADATVFVVIAEAPRPPRYVRPRPVRPDV